MTWKRRITGLLSRAVSWRRVGAVLGKELRALLDSPSAIIVIVVFLLLWEFLFFNGAFLVGEASLRSLFDVLPWLLLLFIPAITMGSIAQEAGDGTIEFLLTRPLKDVELVLGKYLAALVYAGVAFLFTIPIAIGFRIFGNVDLGVVAGQIIASLALASVLIAVGIACSSLVRNQVAALLLAAAVSFVLLIAGSPFVTQSLPLSLVSLFERLSPASHFSSTARGVLDLRDAWYTLSMTAIFLGVALLSLLQRRFGHRTGKTLRLRLGVAAVVLLILATNVSGARIPGRLDLTRGRLYTLSDGTRNILGALPVPVFITLYASPELPVQLQSVLRDIRDTLADYRVLGRGNVVIAEKDPVSDEAAAKEAQEAGIQQMQFNVVGQGEFQMKSGMLGIGITARGQTKSLPFVQDTGDLEYRLTMLINTLTEREKKKIVFVGGHGEKPAGEMTALRAQLQSQFTVEDVSLTGRTTLPQDAAAVVVAGPTQTLPAAAERVLQEYLADGGAGLFLLDGVQPDLQNMMGRENGSGALDLLADVGVMVNPDIVYDLRSHETVQMGSSFQMLLVPYPFWITAQPASSSPVTSRLEHVVLPWGSSISVSDPVAAAAGYTIVPLLQTSDAAGAASPTSPLDPRVNFPQEGLSKQTVAVALQGSAPVDASSAMKPKGRIVVTGDSDFLTDQMVGNNATNLAFALNAFSWMTEQESLGDIQVKQRAAPRLVFSSAGQQSMLQYGNLILAAGLPILLGLSRLLRRRKLGKFTYETLRQRGV